MTDVEFVREIVQPLPEDARDYDKPLERIAETYPFKVWPLLVVLILFLLFVGTTTFAIGNMSTIRSRS
jgi:hypothetical protein